MARDTQAVLIHDLVLLIQENRTIQKIRNQIETLQLALVIGLDQHITSLVQPLGHLMRNLEITADLIIKTKNLEVLLRIEVLVRTGQVTLEDRAAEAHLEAVVVDLLEVAQKNQDNHEKYINHYRLANFTCVSI
jgi:hypothetical protein